MAEPSPSSGVGSFHTPPLARRTCFISFPYTRATTMDMRRGIAQRCPFPSGPPTDGSSVSSFIWDTSVHIFVGRSRPQNNPISPRKPSLSSFLTRSSLKTLARSLRSRASFKCHSSLENQTRGLISEYFNTKNHDQLIITAFSLPSLVSVKITATQYAYSSLGNDSASLAPT